LTINGRRKSFGYYADEIEAAKAYDRVRKKTFPPPALMAKTTEKTGDKQYEKKRFS